VLSVLMLRGEGAVKAAYSRGEHRAFKYILLIAPISKTYLLHSDMLREVASAGETLVIPSSYDDVAIYVNMRREGYKICYRQAAYEDLTVARLERGERPWRAISMWERKGYLLVFSEDLEPLNVIDIYGAQKPPGIAYVSYGVMQPVGIRARGWISLRLNPFRDTVSRIYMEEGMRIELETPIGSLSYRV